MEDFLKNYGLFILFGAMMLFMMRRGGGCCGGHRKHDEHGDRQRQHDHQSGENKDSSAKKGCH